MEKYIRRVLAENLHGRFVLEQEFLPGINVLHGRNGTGKTTLLHVLANALNGDFRRFAFLTFGKLTVEIAEASGIGTQTVELVRSGVDDDLEILVIVDGKEFETIPVEETIISELEIARDFRRGEQEREIPDHSALLPTAYFPAFRTMIEAWSSSQETSNFRPYVEYSIEYRRARRRGTIPDDLMTTLFARGLFGHFVPSLSYPSPIEIEQRIASEYQKAMLQIGEIDRELLSEIFLEVIRTLSLQTEEPQEDLSSIVERVSRLLDELAEAEYPLQSGTGHGVYYQLQELLSSFQDSQAVENKLVARVLEVYREPLEKRLGVQKESFQGIQTYLKSVNSFLEGKHLQLSPVRSRPSPILQVRFDDDTVSDIRTLSSGEREIVAQVYAATHMNEQRVVLIDEPEISLHIDWQRHLLKSMAEQLGSRQVIVCTHSPTIGADHEDRMSELLLKPSPNPLSEEGDFVDDAADDVGAFDVNT